MNGAKKLYLLFMTAVLLLFFPALLSHASNTESEVNEEPWFLSDLRAKESWDNLDTLGISFDNPVIVAVIDTGSDYSHPLIASALWTNTSEENGIEGVDDDGNGYIDDLYGIDTCNHSSDPMDDSVGSISGHGTHVAGTILQTAGVTLTENPFHIRLMILKAGDAYGNFNAANVAEAIRYAADNGASVINMSFSSVKAPAILREALEYASDSAILVASAGNKGLPTSDSSYTACDDYYPAGYPFVAGVMSYGTDHTLSSFSNWDAHSYTGAEYEIAAPGEAIRSCTYQGAYKAMKGTSMAAGVISGCAALLVRKYQDTGLYTPRELTAHLMEACTEPIPYTDSYGQSHSFGGMNLVSLLEEEPQTKLVLADFALSAKESSPRSFTLNYALMNRGCAASEISVEITCDYSGSPETDSSQKPPEKLEALAQYEGSFQFTVADDLPEGTPMTFSLSVSYKDAKVPLNATITALIGDNPSDMKPEIPLQGISLFPAPQMLLKAGTSRSLSVSYIPENTTDDRTITFVSSAPLTASVDEYGLVTAHQPGSAVLSAFTSRGQVRSVTVTVYAGQEDTDPESEITESEITEPDIPQPGTPEADLPVTDPSANGKITIVKGKTYQVKGLKYKITSLGKKASATLTGTSKRKNSLRSLTVCDKVSIGGKSFRVTAVGKGAFRGCRKLRSLQIGKYVKSLGQNCFRGCAGLTRLTIRSRQLKAIGSNALKGISKKAVVRIPHGKLSQYRKLLGIRTGFRASMRLKKF